VAFPLVGIDQHVNVRRVKSRGGVQTRCYQPVTWSYYSLPIGEDRLAAILA
jgi:hypothetical protein